MDGDDMDDDGMLDNRNYCCMLNQNIDILIAIHACETATDDSIWYGIQSKSSIIVTTPCCGLLLYSIAIVVTDMATASFIPI